MKSFGFLSFPSLPGHWLSHWVLAGGGGKTSLLQGWKQVLLASQLTPEFLPFIGAVRITPGIHPTEQEQENSVLELPRVSKRKTQSQNVTGLQWQALSKDSPTFSRVPGISRIPDIFTYIITRASHSNVIYVSFYGCSKEFEKKWTLIPQRLSTSLNFKLKKSIQK